MKCKVNCTFWIFVKLSRVSDCYSLSWALFGWPFSFGHTIILQNNTRGQSSDLFKAFQAEFVPESQVPVFFWFFASPFRTNKMTSVCVLHVHTLWSFRQWRKFTSHHLELPGDPPWWESIKLRDEGRGEDLFLLRGIFRCSTIDELKGLFVDWKTPSLFFLRWMGLKPGFKEWRHRFNWETEWNLSLGILFSLN